MKKFHTVVGGVGIVPEDSYAGWSGAAVGGASER